MTLTQVDKLKKLINLVHLLKNEKTFRDLGSGFVGL